MERSDLAIVIPAHNEERTIGRVVERALPYGLVIVVDDASHDETGRHYKNSRGRDFVK